MAFLLLPFSLTLCLLNFVRANLLICHYIHPCLFTVYLLGQHTCNLVSSFYCPTENFLHQLFLDPFAYNICFVFDTGLLPKRVGFIWRHHAVWRTINKKDCPILLPTLLIKPCVWLVDPTWLVYFIVPDLFSLEICRKLGHEAFQLSITYSNANAGQINQNCYYWFVTTVRRLFATALTSDCNNRY